MRTESPLSSQLLSQLFQERIAKVSEKLLTPEKTVPAH